MFGLGSTEAFVIFWIVAPWIVVPVAGYFVIKAAVKSGVREALAEHRAAKEQAGS